MVDLATYGMHALELHSAHLNSICVPDVKAQVAYDVLADALVWSDETIESTPFDVVEGLRQLRHYRTHVMLSNSEPDNEVWLHCRSMFPHWVGFLPERHKPTAELHSVYRRGEVSTRWCLRQLERESGATDCE